MIELRNIQHGHWVTTIEKIQGRNYHQYCVTTTSPFRNIQPQSFCNTWDQAKDFAAQQMQEAEAIDRNDEI